MDEPRAVQTASVQVRSPGASIPRGLKTMNQAIAGAIASVAITTVIVGWLRSQTDVVDVNSVYLLAVLALGSLAGRMAAILAAFLSFLSVNYFFVEPIFTLHVANPREWLTLTILLVTALISGQLTAALRDRARDAERRRAEVAFLYELGQILGQRGPLQDRIAEALTCLTEARSLRPECVSVNLVDGSSIAPNGSQPASQPALRERECEALDHGAIVTPGWKLQEHDWSRLASDPKNDARPSRGAVWVPLLVGGMRVGALVLLDFPLHESLRPDWRRLILAVATLLAQTIERDRLAQVATEAEVLQRADDLKSALLSSVSHDLRTPLASIKASVNALLDPSAHLDTDERTDLLEGVSEETDRLTRFVTHLLQLSRLESGAVAPQAEWYEINEIIWEVIDALDPSEDRLRVQVPPTFGLVHVDYVMLVQILTNLVENALRYSPAHRPVELVVEPAENNWRILVMDRGPGVPEADREHIFEKFFRSQSRAHGGSGVGLAVARGLAQAHRGDVWYEARVGGGSCFVLELPRDELPN